MNNDFLEQLYDNFNKTINKHNFDMMQLFIYYSCTCYQDKNFKDFKNEEKQKILYFIYKAYMKDENHTDLGFICDIAMENSDEILKDNINLFSTWDLLNKCYERM